MLSQEASTMNKLTILLLLFFSFWPAAVLCDNCQLKKNARDLISVDYFSTSDYTYVDQIDVRMKENKRKFGQLLFKDGCSEKTLTASLHKRTGKKSEVVEIERKTGFKFEQLDPCAVYEVNVTIGNHEVGSYKVGPYYSQDNVHHPFLSDDDNPKYEAREGWIKTVTEYNHSAVIELGPVCAGMVMLDLREKHSNETTHHWDQEKTTITSVMKRITPSKESGAKLVVENLKPCTQYTVDIELWLDGKRSPTDGDFQKDQIFYFYTMPDYNDNSTYGQRHLRSRNKMNIVRSEDDTSMPKECYIEDNPSMGKLTDQKESWILQITIGASLLVVLVATILACSLTFSQRHRGKVEMKKLLSDSPSLDPVFTTIIPIEPDPDTDEQTVVLLKYADLSKTY